MKMLEMSRDAPLLAFEASTTIEDQMAFNRYIRTLPHHKQQRTRWIIGAVSTAPLFALFICIVMHWTLRGGDCDLDSILGSDGRGALFLKVLGCVALAETAMAMIYRLYWSRNSERSVRQGLSKRLHIDDSDFTMRETLSVAFFSWGFSIDTAYAAELYDWRYVERIDESKDHIFLMTSPRLGLIFSKRDIPAAAILALRDLMKPTLIPNRVSIDSRVEASGPWG